MKLLTLLNRLRSTQDNLHGQQLQIGALQSALHDAQGKLHDLALKRTSETTLLTRQAQELRRLNTHLNQCQINDHLLISKLQGQLAEAVKSGSGNTTETLNQRTAHLVAEINRKNNEIERLTRTVSDQRTTINKRMADIEDLESDKDELQSALDLLSKQPRLTNFVVTTGAILSVILNMVIIYILLG